MTAAVLGQRGTSMSLILAQQRLKELEQLLAAASRETASSPSDPASDALNRMLTGTPLPADEGALGVRVVGARLVVLSAPVALPRQRNAVSAPLPDGCVAVLCGAQLSRGEGDRALDSASMVAADARRRTGASAGVSASIAASGDLPAALRDARDAAWLAAEREEPLCLVPDVAAQLAVHRLRRRALTELTLADPVVSLLEHDRVNGTDLAGTVAAWLRHDRDVRRAARVLNLHPNSLRYRLRRIPQVSAFLPTDPDHVLLAQLLLP